MTDDQQGRHFNFILGEAFSLFCLSSAIETLRAANLIVEQPYYSWSLISHDGARIQASNGLYLDATASVEDMPPAEITFVAASSKIEVEGLPRIINALRLQGRRGAKLGALSVGSFILAKAGLLDGYRCTIHWQNRAAMTEAFPNVDCTGSVYEIDRNRYTCAGGTTGIDLMLEIIRRDFGADVANNVANNFQYERIRSPDDRQRMGREPDLSGKSEKLKRLVVLMSDNLEEPLSAGELAGSVQLSVRQVERLFLKHLNSTPGRYYMTLRLERARQLLRQTNTPILDVALATGFTSHSYFAQSYRAQFGHAPSDERRKTG